MEKTTDIIPLRQPESVDDPLTEIARDGARRMLAAALRAEADAFVAEYAEEVLPDGRQPVVRHGYGPERSIQTGIGALDVQRPKVRDRATNVPADQKIRFTSAILPKWARRSRSLDALLPVLYLRGISTGDFQEALAAILGKDAPNLSPSVISRLTGEWQQDYDRWQRRDLSTRRYVYFWADGVYLREGKLSPVMRQRHPAGERLFVDYAGPTIDVIDPTTGEVRAAQLFVATLGASSYTYAEATLTQSLPDWIASHESAFAFFGGVTAQVVPDNLKSGVIKACFYEPEVNRTYADLVAHYDTAVIPARPYKPKDKAKAEAAVLLAERWILAALRNRQFFSLDELNAAISPLLETLNSKMSRHLGASRRELFEQLDKPVRECQIFCV